MAKFCQHFWPFHGQSGNPALAMGRCGLLANEAKFLHFAKFQTLPMKLFAAVLSISTIC